MQQALQMEIRGSAYTAFLEPMAPMLAFAKLSPILSALTLNL